MTKHNLFSNVLATNGLARGYGPRPHKRKRKGLWLAFFILLIAVVGAVYGLPDRRDARTPSQH